MNIEELREYLGIVVDMEQNIFFQRSLWNHITQEIERLRIPKNIIDPSEPVKPKPLSTSYIWGVIVLIGSSFGLWFASMLVIMVFLELQRAFAGTKTYPNEWMVLLSFVAPTVNIYSFIATRKKEAEDNKKLLEQYQLQLSKYKKKIDENQKIRQQDEANRRAKIIFLQNQKVEIGKWLTTAKGHLQKIYDKNIIFPKYRNLTMVCSLYEYICAGRCTELEGHEGAYNIIETEIRLDHIILQLDKVIAQLEQIKNNQFMLYSAVQESNHRSSLIQRDLDRMAGSLDGLYTTTAQLNANAAQLNARIIELQETSALTAYYTERTQKELTYMNRMDYLSGRNDDVFWNHPPV